MFLFKCHKNVIHTYLWKIFWGFIMIVTGERDRECSGERESRTCRMESIPGPCVEASTGEAPGVPGVLPEFDIFN